jgi:RNA polymerase sigma factor (sigma-70 family)
MGDADDDATLVQRALDGEAEAFALLYRRYKKHVWDLSYYLCARNHHEAEEATQDTFLKAWRGLRGYGGRSTFKSWLLSICRNVCIDRRRRKSTATVHLSVWPRSSGAATGWRAGRAARSRRTSGSRQWSDRELDLRPDGFGRERYALVEDGHKLATIESTGGWGRRPANITVGDPDGIDPGLLLFAVFVVTTLAQTPQAAAAA